MDGVQCLGQTLEGKLAEKCKPTWVTTTGLPMDDSYGTVINGVLDRYGTIVKTTRKKLWRGTKLWTTEWETLLFLKFPLRGGLPTQ